MSGTNRAVMSEIVMKGGSEEELANALNNANEEQIKNDSEVSKK